MKILIFVPAYNCASQIDRVIRSLDSIELGDAQVRVVDNCSKDQTAEAAEAAILKTTQSEKFGVIRNPRNLGLGGSFKRTFMYAQENGFSHFCIFHGDNQADIKDAQTMLGRIKRGEGNQVLFGARFMKDSRLTNYSKIREYVNRSLNQLTSLLYRTNVYDVGSGLNAYPIKHFPKEFIESLPSHAAFDIHILIYTLKNSIPFQFFPIHWKSEDEKSTVSDFHIGWEILSAVLRGRRD